MDTEETKDPAGALALIASALDDLDPEDHATATATFGEMANLETLTSIMGGEDDEAVGRLARLGAAAALRIEQIQRKRGEAPTRPPVVNRGRLERVVSDIRYKLLANQVEEGLHRGQVRRFVRVTPELLEDIATAVDAGLLALSMGFESLKATKGDVLVLRVPDPRHVPGRAVEILQQALSDAAQRAGIGDGEETGRVLVLGPDGDLEQMTDAQLRGLGFARLPIEPSKALEGLVADYDDRRGG